jgi:hypothetical protein
MSKISREGITYFQTYYKVVKKEGGVDQKVKLKNGFLRKRMLRGLSRRRGISTAKVRESENVRLEGLRG